MNKTIIDKLNRLGACSEAVRWMTTQVSPSVAWRNCKRGDWMLWLLGQQAGDPEGPARKKLVLCACDCARLALKHVPAGELRPLRCIETAERWAHGKATIQEVSEARAADYDAAYADAADDDADDAYAAAAAYAAAHAADAAAADAAYAADAAAAYAAAAYARSLTLAQCAKIVRKHYPKPPTL
jgi:hypothetical protein